PRTLHSLYLVSHRPCIHYNWSPQTLHSLYLVSHSTQNRNAIILVNINC
ncbi:unnamed protein product, partial [Staurois parvus]